MNLGFLVIYFYLSLVNKWLFDSFPIEKMNLIATLRSVNEAIICAMFRLTVHLNCVAVEFVIKLLGMTLLFVSDKQNNLVVVFGREDCAIKPFAALAPKLCKFCPVPLTADRDCIECDWHRLVFNDEFSDFWQFIAYPFPG